MPFYQLENFPFHTSAFPPTKMLAHQKTDTAKPKETAQICWNNNWQYFCTFLASRLIHSATGSITRLSVACWTLQSRFNQMYRTLTSVWHYALNLRVLHMPLGATLTIIASKCENLPQNFTRVFWVEMHKKFHISILSWNSSWGIALILKNLWIQWFAGVIALGKDCAEDRLLNMDSRRMTLTDVIILYCYEGLYQLW